MEQLAQRMAAADTEGIRALLRPDAVVIVDSGRVVDAVTRPVEGDRAAASALAEVASAEVASADCSARAVSINGAPGFVLSRSGVVFAAVTAETRGARLTRAWVVSNPEKLRHWNRG
ncbi:MULTISPECIES: hypothetical protein [unclassified Microbacterium]|uniref:hypothetical protein n=1 Tax=unclassified Microbacterium TaxID=2609290 RepID=UPI001AEDED5F|nr:MULTISPECIES: hypothetical protein [unclassified Microbacterium]QYM64287.1 hypothetical protein K1X59_19955 [Microbacterium sp. Se5.02b]